MYQHEHPLAPSLACSVLEIDERNAKYPERYCLSLDILTAYPYKYFSNIQGNFLLMSTVLKPRDSSHTLSVFNP